MPDLPQFPDSTGARPDDTAVEPDRRSTTSASRVWTVIAFIVLALVLVFIVIHLLGVRVQH